MASQEHNENGDGKTKRTNRKIKVGDLVKPKTIVNDDNFVNFDDIGIVVHKKGKVCVVNFPSAKQTLSFLEQTLILVSSQKE